jgi:hypothetical protein
VTFQRNGNLETQSYQPGLLGIDAVETTNRYAEELDAMGVNYRPLAGPHPWQRGGTGPRARYDR